MIWQINWEGESTAGLWVALFGENLEGLLIQGIENGMEELEYLQAVGHHCDACGEFRITYRVDFNEDVITDERGSVYRLVPYDLCAECRRELGRDPC